MSLKAKYPLMLLLVLALVLLAQLALASGGGGHAEEGVPKVVLYQAINFGLFVLLCWYLGRKAIAGYFKGRVEGFQQALVKAQAALNEATQHKKEIQDRLTQLSRASAGDIQRAKEEAAELHLRLLAEARELASNLKTEAERTAKIEIEKAKLQLREELIRQSMQMAKKSLNEKMADNDQKRLQTEFVEKIQAVPT